MKNTLLLSFVLFVSQQTIFAQLTTFFVRPNTFDSAYSISDDSNFVAINPAIAPLNKLLVFLPGSGALTKHYQLFPNLAANLGYHAIGLAYPNSSTVSSACSGSTNTDCFKNIREEVCYGHDVSSDVSVDSLNCIQTRLIKMLQYMDATYPSQNWGQFLNGNLPDYSKIVLSGHSQGSGHALYLSKSNETERVIMFAGADDYSMLYSQAANWISSTSQTSVNHLFSFLHLEDDVINYAYQYAVIEAAGMTGNGDDSTSTDGLSSPFNHSHCLYTDLAPKYPNIYSAKHSGMVVDFFTPTDANSIPVYEPVWTYLLTESTNTAAIQETDDLIQFQVNPNPADEHIYIQFEGTHAVLTIRDATGKICLSPQTISNNESISTNQLVPGVYFIQLQTTNGSGIRQLIIH